MNRRDVDKQRDLYEQGLTSIEEEKDLVNRSGEAKTKTDIWFNYIKQHKIIAPQNLKSNIWTSIQKREKRKRRILLSISTVAASVILVVSVFLTIQIWPQEKMSYAEKAAAFEEAQAMISEAQEQATLDEILYENEFLIIYTK